MARNLILYSFAEGRPVASRRLRPEHHRHRPVSRTPAGSLDQRTGGTGLFIAEETTWNREG